MTRVRIAVDRAAAGAGAEHGPSATPRRIWDVDVNALLFVVPLLLGRDGMRAILTRHGSPDPGRDALLAHDIVARCQRPCSLATEVERELDRRTARLRHFSIRCPAAVVASWWLDAEGEDAPALLWSIASDARFDLDGASCARRVHDARRGTG